LEIQNTISYNSFQGCTTNPICLSCCLSKRARDDQIAKRASRWEVRTSDGIVRRFEPDIVGRFGGAEGPWLLREEQDAYDNTITYRWTIEQM